MMRYRVYKRTDVSNPMMVCYGDEAFFRYLAGYQVELKETRMNYKTLKEEVVYNNAILDSVYLGQGDGLYAILSEYDSFVDPRNYYEELLAYRKEYRYGYWYRRHGILLTEEKGPDFVYRRGPVPDIHCHWNTNRYRQIHYSRLLREVSHEDYAAYNRHGRSMDILSMKGYFYDNGRTKTSHGDKC